MSTWTSLSPIFTNIREIINQQVSELSDQLYSWVMPCLSCQETPTNADIKRIVMGTKSYDDMSFPQCHIIPVNDRIETVANKIEEHNMNFRIVIIQEDAGSPWGGSLKTMQLSSDVHDALYAVMNSQLKRSLGGACNDIFVQEITWETEPFKSTSIQWNFMTVLVKKRVSV
jgi:hypothetical protein